MTRIDDFFVIAIRAISRYKASRRIRRARPLAGVAGQREQRAGPRSGFCVLPLALVFSLYFAAPALSAESWQLADLMAAMSDVPSISSRFTEKKHLAMLKEPLTLSGTLTYRRPDFIEKHVLAPYEERYTVDGDKVTFENRAKQQKRSFALDSNPVIRAFVDSIRATLAGDTQALQRYYRIDLRGSRAAWVLNLEPLDAQMSEQVSTIRLSGAGSAVDEVVVFEPGGDKSVMTIAAP